MSSDNLLSVKIEHRVGALALDVAFNLTQPWTVLFGPSGSGKTTILRAIAGFTQPDAGHISLRSSVVFDSAAGISVPPHQRLVRSAAQSGRLFPHMTTLQNIAYGVDPASTNSSAIVEEAVNRFYLGSLTRKSPRQLSGGERQRVAVVRAGVAAASLGAGTLLVLDEPFTGLDLNRRDEFLEALRGWLQSIGIPVLSVTHDIGEAFQLGAEIIRLSDGRIAAQGPAHDVLSGERLRLLNQLRS